MGYTITYDPETISLILAVADHRAAATRSLDLTDQGAPTVGVFDRPRSSSGFLTADASIDYDWTGPTRGVNDAMVLLDGAVRYRGVVLESEENFPGEEAPRATPACSSARARVWSTLT